MSKQLRWKTIGKLNVERKEHSWTIRLVGKPEYRYLKELIEFLDANEFVYRLTTYRTWHFAPNQKYKPFNKNRLYPTGTINIDLEHTQVYEKYMGELFAAGYGATVRVLVYKNTTHLEVVDRKEVF
jgi:hypothetical protein